MNQVGTLYDSRDNTITLTFTNAATLISALVAVGDTTLNVDTTEDLSSSGSGIIIDTHNDQDAFAWTGSSATTLTGCSGLLAHNNRASVRQCQDLSSATKIEVIINDTAYNSTDNASAFDLTDVATGVVVLDFGALGIEDGEYPVTIVVYDATNTNGIVWTHKDDKHPLVLRILKD